MNHHNRITNLPAKFPSRATRAELTRYMEIAVSHDYAFHAAYDAVLWKRELVDYWWTREQDKAVAFLAAMERKGFRIRK